MSDNSTEYSDFDAMQTAIKQIRGTHDDNQRKITTIFQQIHQSLQQSAQYLPQTYAAPNGENDVAQIRYNEMLAQFYDLSSYLEDLIPQLETAHTRLMGGRIE